MLRMPGGAIGPVLMVFLIIAITRTDCKAQLTPLPNAFAHNDYKHKHPLFDALDNGFANIEADIFLEDSTLVVGHFCPIFRYGKNLEKLYLKPLYERVMQNKGRVYVGYDHPVILMIDVKTEADTTYRALERMLNRYQAMLTHYEDGKVIEGAVTVVISGHKPYRIIENEKNRLAFIDEDLRRVARDTTTSNVFKMASCKYSHLLKWDGRGPLPLHERQRLLNFVAIAHRMGEKVRLWASPENKLVWDELLRDGVDLINTDQLATLRKYLDASSLTLAKAD